MEREPRAALILNRFTRNLTIMYATDAVAQILGVRPDELLERPFYECIQPNCLDEAERCLESAKANESIAYLRFWYKDPRVDPNEPVHEDEVDEMDEEADDKSSPNESEADVKDPGLKESCMDLDDEELEQQTSGKDETGGNEEGPRSRARALSPQRRRPQSPQTFELEAVVSCTSDGLVVVLRRARPPIPDPQPPVIPAAFNFENGLFAAPWGLQPIEPYISPELLYTFRPPLLPQYMPLRECVKAAGGPPLDRMSFFTPSPPPGIPLPNPNDYRINALHPRRRRVRLGRNRHQPFPRKLRTEPPEDRRPTISRRWPPRLGTRFPPHHVPSARRSLGRRQQRHHEGSSLWPRQSVSRRRCRGAAHPRFPYPACFAG
jgi:hypothetical protein